MADGTAHDVVYLADMANQVWAFDANNGASLWKQELGTPVQGSQSIDHWQINDHWGVLGTPVIDAAAGIMYLVAWSSPDGSAAKAQHFCHALSLRDGSATSPAVNLEGATYDPGHGLPVLQFRSAARKQRPGLLLTEVNGVKTVHRLRFGQRDHGGGSRLDPDLQHVTAGRHRRLDVDRSRSGGRDLAGWGRASRRRRGQYLRDDRQRFLRRVTDFGESFVKLAYSPLRLAPRLP